MITKYYTTRGGERMDAKIIYMAPSEISKVNSLLTNSHFSILTSLYYKPEQQQKILAANVHIPITSLSNMLTKISKLNPPLISCTKAGRNHYYSLTDAGRYYVEEKLDKKKSSNLIRLESILSPTDDAMPSNETNALNHLNQFKELTGVTWRIDMLHMLQNGNTINDPAYHALDSFLKSVRELMQTENTDSLKRIYGYLNDKSLESAIDSYLAKTFGDYFVFRSLYHLDPSECYKIVNDVFTEMVNGPIVKNNYIDSLITEQEYYILYYQISCKMKKDFLTYMKNESLTVDYWKNKYSPSSAHLLFYIASRFTLYFHQ